MVDKLSYFGISSTARFIICGIFSLILIVCDSHFNYFRDLRYTLEIWLTPVYYVANMLVVFGR